MTQPGHAASDPAHAVKCKLAGEVLRSSGTLRLRVTGWSMLPTVMPEDRLIVDRLDGEVSRGDIVVFSRNQRLVAHRVISTASGEEDCIVTQGDGMPRPDAPLTPAELLGKVSLIVRSGRCAKPATKLGAPERVAAELVRLVRRSELAARIVVGVHHMRQRLKESPVNCQS